MLLMIFKTSVLTKFHVEDHQSVQSSSVWKPFYSFEFLLSGTLVAVYILGGQRTIPVSDISGVSKPLMVLVV